MKKDSYQERNWKKQIAGSNQQMMKVDKRITKKKQKRKPTISNQMQENKCNQTQQNNAKKEKATNQPTDKEEGKNQHLYCIPLSLVLTMCSNLKLKPSPPTTLPLSLALF